MKSCPFEYNWEYIVMYHDGVMSPDLEKRFEEHLVTCQTCMEMLLNLQNDLVAMSSMKLHTVPEELVAGKSRQGERHAFFQFVHEMLDMVSGSFGTGCFENVPAPAVRGKEKVSYVASALGVEVRLVYEERDLFNIEFTKVRGRSVELQKDGQSIEKRRDMKNDSFLVEELPKGTYSISIDEMHAMTFTVK